MIAVTWLLTYLLQSTLLLGAAWLVGRLLRRHAVIQETVWRVAVLGSIAAALLVAGGVVRPLAGTIAVGDLRQGREVFGDRAPARSATQLSSVADTNRSALPTASATAAGAPDTIASGTTRDEAPIGSNRIVDSTAGSSGVTGLSWSVVALAGWGTTASMLVAWHFMRRHRLFSLLARRELVTDAAVNRMFADLCAAAGLRRVVRLTISPACPVPMALTPSEVCVPAHFLDALDAEQQRGALAHEVAHVARRDPDWLTVDALIGALFFFQPLNMVARRALREHAEWQCDDWAAGQGAALGLARCLADVATWLRPFPRHLLAVTVPMAGRRSDFVHRVERLLSDAGEVAPARRSRPLAAACLGVVAVTSAAPAFSAAVPVLPSLSFAPAELIAVRHALVASVNRTAEVQSQIVRAPRAGDPLGERWAWALRDAAARSRRDYWVGYSFVYPLRPREQHVSDSEGIDFDRLDWNGVKLGDTLGVGTDNGIAVLVRYSGGMRQSIA